MSQPGTNQRAQTLRLQGPANRVARGLLRTPLVSRLIGRRLLIVYVVGRKSRRRYDVPVAYVRDRETLLISSPFPWMRNLRSGQSVDILLLGSRRTVDVQVLTDEPGVVECLALMARRNRQFAKFNKIEIDEGGQPDANDLHLAWAAGARVARLTPS